MATRVLMPMPGQMTEECTLLAWRKAEGDPVARGDVLFEIETDKSTMEVEAFEDGVLLRILVPEGATVPVNTVCAWIGAPGEAVPEEVPTAAVPATTSPESTTAVAPAPVRASLVAAPGAPAPPMPPGGASISPRASRLATGLGLDIRTLRGTGPAGRIVERDVRAAAAVGGTGPPLAAPPVAQPAPGEGPGRPMSRLRQTIARRLTESVRNAPQFSVTVAVDMTAAAALRAELKSRAIDVSVTDLVLWATAGALAEFPVVNGRTDGERVWERDRVHLGMAVAVPGGLLVPVIHDADRMTLAEIHAAAADRANAARVGRLGPDELSGSTFTVTNMGMLDIEQFDPIINPGESGILSVASIIPTPAAVGEGIAVRGLMRITLAADHRLVDGELGARFVNAIRRRLEDADAIRAAAGD